MINTFPDEIKLTIFGFLPVSARGKAATVCKKWNSLLENDILWKPLLNETLASKEISKTAKQCFIQFPDFRIKEMDCDEKGKRYLLHQKIDAIEGLLDTQRRHAKSLRVSNLILAGKLSLEDALRRSLPPSLRQTSSPAPELQDFSPGGIQRYLNVHRDPPPLDIIKKSCIGLGLTYEEVTQRSFSDYHARAIELGYDYDAIKNLTALQVNAWTQYGLTREQALHSALREDHLRALDRHFKYDDVIDLNAAQLDGLMSNLGLTRKQVKHSWYTRFHTQAMQKGVLYESVKGLNAEAVKKLLTDEEVLSGQYIFHSHPVITLKK